MIKGVLHIHSDISPEATTDSTVSLEYAKSLFKEKGFSFMMLAEHAEYLDEQKYQAYKEQCRRLCDEEFVLIPGIEIKWKEQVHFLAYGADCYMKNEETLSVKETIAKIRATTKCRLLVWGHINDPLSITKGFLPALASVDGIEVFNTTYHSIFPDGRGLIYLNYLAHRSKKVLAFGGLDMHETKNHSKMACLINNECPVERNSILDAIALGQYILHGKVITLRPQGEYSVLLIWWSIVINAVIDMARKVRRKYYNALQWQVIEDKTVRHGID